MSEETEYIEQEDALNVANYKEQEDGALQDGYAEQEDTLHVVQADESDHVNNAVCPEQEDATQRGEAWERMDQDVDQAIEGNQTIGGSQHVRGNAEFDSDAHIGGVLYAPVIRSRMLLNWRDYIASEGLDYPLSAYLGYYLYLRDADARKLINTIQSVLQGKVDKPTMDAAIAAAIAGIKTEQPPGGADGGNAETAKRLFYPHTLWGQSFDGTADVSGTLRNVTDLFMIGSLKIGNATISYDAANDALRFDKGLYSDYWVSALGANGPTSSGGGGGGGYELLQQWDNYNSGTAQQMALSAYLGYDLRTMVNALSGSVSENSSQISTINSSIGSIHTSLQGKVSKSDLDAALLGYLPLTGGTLTGPLFVNHHDGLRIGDVWLRWDAERSAVRVESAVSGETVGLYADGWLSAGGANASAGGGGSSFDLLQLWENYNGATAQQMALSAYLGKDLKDRIEAMHVPSKVSELENDSGFVDGEEVDGRLAAKADKATTLGGYGISDAYTKTESDEAAKDMRKTGYAMTETIIDTSALNTDTFYPVTMQIPQTARVRIEIVNSLDGGLPSGAWGGSDTRGPSVFYAWYATGNGWGARNGMNRTIIVAYRNATWTRVQVVGGIWQMSNSSTEYVYVRGGTKWRFRTSHGVVPILRTSRYEVTNQYVAPRTDAPDEPVMNLLADSANKLSTKRSIFIKDATATHIGTPTDFDGSEAVTLLLPDTIDAELNGNAGTAGKLKTAVNLWGNSFDGSKAIEGSISENNTGLDMDVYNATGNSANAWNVKYNARFISDNNALTINVSGTSNQRCAMMQVGHAKNQYAAFLGPLYLNPLGGNVGIGGKSATEKLHVHGNIIATGAITAKSSSSDSRLKKDIADYDALALISRIVAVCFKWNDTARANSEVFRTDAVQYGFIAQQLQEAGLGQFVQDKFGDYLTVDYERFVPIAVKAVQELKSENNSLKSEIDALKADLSALKADLLGLKKLVVLR